ncbi:MAG: GspMb/PilO family protein [Armatimonadota bacterium]
MRDKHKILLTGLFVVAVAGWLWAASAFWQYQNLRNQIRSLRDQTVETQKLLERAKEQKERYGQLVQELGKPLTIFDPGRMTAKFMEQVEGALTQSKIKAETIQPLPWQINSELSAVRLAVQVTAITTQPTVSEGLQGLTELLMRLRSMRPPISVERLNVQAINQPREGLRVQAQLVWLIPVEDAVLKKWATQTRPTLRR